MSHLSTPRCEFPYLIGSLGDPRDHFAAEFLTPLPVVVLDSIPNLGEDLLGKVGVALGSGGEGGEIEVEGGGLG